MKLPIFNEGEYVCASMDERGISLIPVEKLDTAYTFVAINPLGKEGTRRDSNVTELRNILVELDETPLKDQRRIVEDSGLPVTMITYSGGKSLHFIISLETPLSSKTAYKELVRRIYKALPEADRANSNPSRFTRVPGHRREGSGRLQSLLYSGRRVSNDALELWLLKQGVTPEMGRLRRLELRPPLQHGQRFPLSARTYHFLRFLAPEGSRHRELVRACFDFAECGWPEGEALATLERAYPHADAFEIFNALSHAYLKVGISRQEAEKEEALGPSEEGAAA